MAELMCVQTTKDAKCQESTRYKAPLILTQRITLVFDASVEDKEHCLSSSDVIYLQSGKMVFLVQDRGLMS